MEFFVTTSQAPHSFRVLWSKEEFFDYISKMIDEKAEAGCTTFELTVSANKNKED